VDGITRRLSTHGLVGLDTSVFIYHFENHPDFLPLTRAVLKGAAYGRWQALTSTITLMELAVLPFRQNRPRAAQAYEAILANFPNLEIVDIDRDAARKAAQLRAEYNLRPADALQIGAAIVNGATAWVGNDRTHVRAEKEIAVVLLDEFARK
jgi:predicted nucleic acid-binding protein